VLLLHILDLHFGSRFNSAGPINIRVMSAGTRPARRVSRKVVRVMREIGLNISGAKPKLLTMEMVEKADKIMLKELR